MPPVKQDFDTGVPCRERRDIGLKRELVGYERIRYLRAAGGGGNQPSDVESSPLEKDQDQEEQDEEQSTPEEPEYVVAHWLREPKFLRRASGRDRQARRETSHFESSV